MSSALKNCSCTAEDIHIYDFYASFGRRRYRKPIKRMIVTSVSDSDGMCEDIGGLQGAAKKFRGPDGPERPEPKKASNGASWRSGPKSLLKLLNLDAPCISSRIKCCNLQLAITVLSLAGLGAQSSFLQGCFITIILAQVSLKPKVAFVCV